METQIQIKVGVDEKNLIRKASRQIGLGHSTFCRTVALREARLILNQNREEHISA